MTMDLGPIPPNPPNHDFLLKILSMAKYSWKGFMTKWFLIQMIYWRRCSTECAYNHPVVTNTEVDEMI